MSRKVYCIGDSHVSVFLGKDKLAPLFPAINNSVVKEIEIIRLGGVLAYNLCNYNSASKGRENLEYELLNRIPLKSYVIVSAGEIDIRVHLLKQAEKQKKSLEEVADALAIRYTGYLNTLRDKHNIVILMPPPASFLSDNKVDLEYPRFGSEIQRNKMTEIVIQSLIKECKFLKIPYISIYDKAVTAEGLTKRLFLWDGIHLSTYAFSPLLNQLNIITGLNLKIPLTWWIIERVRRVKKILKSK